MCSASFLSVAISAVGVLISTVAISVVIWDRRRKLLIRAREGKWIELQDDMLFGVIEIYNRSTRPNTITSYAYAVLDMNGNWISLKSEIYKRTPQGEPSVVHNQTPLVIPPYSGVEVPIACFGKWSNFPPELKINLSLGDVFGKRYKTPIICPNP